MKFAICNEIFKDWDFQQICAAARSAGYGGIEIAPFTLGLPENNLSNENRQLLKSIASDNGIQIVGLHWLLANTEGYHIGHPDRTVREKTADYLISLINLCADIGGDIMVFGSLISEASS